MNKKLFFSLFAVLMTLTTMAQYPDVPADLKAAADKMIQEESNIANAVLQNNKEEMRGMRAI